MSFRKLFKPKTVAIIGISLSNDRHPANVVFNKNQLRYPVKVFPVNPRGGMLQGETVYRNISEVPEKVDLAVIAVRAEQVPDTVRDCIQAQAAGAVVISGGFSESGRKDLQDRIVAIAQEAKFPLIGPNCLGIYSPACVDTFFMRKLQDPEGGTAVSKKNRHPHNEDQQDVYGKG